MARSKNANQSVQSNKDAVILKYEQLLIDSNLNSRLQYGGIEELADSIERHGLCQPIHVVLSDKTKQLYTVVDGHRRAKALEILHLRGISMPIPALVVELKSRHEQILYQIRANDNSPLSMLELGFIFARLKSYKFSIADICQRVGKSRVYVDQCLKLTETLPDLQELIKRGKISANCALMILKKCGGDPEKASEVVETLAENTDSDQRITPTMASQLLDQDDREEDREDQEEDRADDQPKTSNQTATNQTSNQTATNQTGTGTATATGTKKVSKDREKLNRTQILLQQALVISSANGRVCVEYDPKVWAELVKMYDI